MSGCSSTSFFLDSFGRKVDKKGGKGKSAAGRVGRRREMLSGTMLRYCGRGVEEGHPMN